MDHEAMFRYAEWLLRRADLLRQEPDPEGEIGAAIEAVEAQMERLWDRIDAEDRRRLGVMGSRLNRLTRGDSSHPDQRRLDLIERRRLAIYPYRGGWLAHRLLGCIPADEYPTGGSEPVSLHVDVRAAIDAAEKALEESDG